MCEKGTHHGKPPHAPRVFQSLAKLSSSEHKCGYKNLLNLIFDIRIIKSQDVTVYVIFFACMTMADEYYLNITLSQKKFHIPTFEKLQPKYVWHFV